MKKTRLTSLVAVYVAVLVLAGALVLGAAAIILRDSETVNSVWSEFNATRNDKALALAAIQREMGYGGMIHAFKTFVFRGNTENLSRAIESIGGAKSAIDQYRSFGITEIERQCLAEIEAVLGAYEKAIDTVEWLYPETLSATSLDQEVAIDDTRALRALAQLDALVFGAGELGDERISKAGLLNRLRALLGYGGLVHRFQNFVLRGNEQDLQSVAEKMEGLSQVLEQYRRRPLREMERQALDDIEGVIAAYMKNLPLAVELRSVGSMPRSVDRAIRIKDDKALSGLLVLTREIVADNQAAADKLTAAIANIRSITVTQVALIVGLILVLAGFTIWLLQLRIIKPISRITNEMRDLAKGHIDTTPHAEATIVEIADMDAALDVFQAHELERRDALEELESRERLFQALLASTPDATIIVDRTGSIQMASTQAEAVFGYARDELIGQKVEMLVPDAIKRGHVARRDSFFENHDVRPMGGNLSLFGKRKSGDVFPVEVSLSPIETTMGLLVAAAVRDVTERKEAERRLESAYEVISESIDYAASIQRSILPHHDSFASIFEDHFILWQPRDKVGGDIYWARIWGDGLFLGLVDCTGHGVPGAFMTLIASGALERALDDVPPGQIGKLLQRLHQLVQLQLGQHEGSSRGGDDGLEMGAIYLDADLANISFAGARFSMFISRADGVEEIKGTKIGIGYRAVPFAQDFADMTLTIRPGDEFFMTTDGLIDQIGGERRRSFGKKRFRKLLEDLHGTSMEEQKARLIEVEAKFRGEEKRRDDVSVIGFKV